MSTTQKDDVFLPLSPASQFAWRNEKLGFEGRIKDGPCNSERDEPNDSEQDGECQSIDRNHNYAVHVSQNEETCLQEKGYSQVESTAKHSKPKDEHLSLPFQPSMPFGWASSRRACWQLVGLPGQLNASPAIKQPLLRRRFYLSAYPIICESRDPPDYLLRRYILTFRPYLRISF